RSNPSWPASPPIGVLTASSSIRFLRRGLPSQSRLGRPQPTTSRSTPTPNGASFFDCSALQLHPLGAPPPAAPAPASGGAGGAGPLSNAPMSGAAPAHGR